ncbi:MAG: methionyl-tRNA formyltransferase [Patescibacteria group bacterium]
MSKIIFFGNEQLSSTRTPSKLHIFKSLIDAGYEIEALVIKDSPQKSRKPRVHPISELAAEHNIPVIRAQSKADLMSCVQELDAELAILVAFGMIIPQSVIDHFPLGILNIHPSLLPEYRGTTPIETAILDGVDKTGVSLIQLSAEMDAGPIYGFAEYDLDTTKGKALITDELGQVSAGLLLSLLPDVLSGALKPMNQGQSSATYTPMLSRNLSLLDPQKDASRLEREVIAYADWPGSTIVFEGDTLTVKNARAVSETKTDSVGTIEYLKETGIIALHTTQGWLAINQVQPQGKASMNVDDYIRGLR